MCQAEVTSPLTPAQARAAEATEGALRDSALVLLSVRPGCGRSTLLRELARRGGAALVGLGEVSETQGRAHPLRLEDALATVVRRALEAHDLVLVDDVHRLLQVTQHWGYPRRGWGEARLVALADLAEAAGKRLVLGGQAGAWPRGLLRRGREVEAPSLGAQDLAALARACGAPPGLDLERAFRFAPGLDARSLCSALRGLEPGAGSERLLERLADQLPRGNVGEGSLAPGELCGVDDVLEALETHVVLPLERADLAAELALRPKRGVLLCGPPGTGKTSLGRALARRLAGKFFLLDGTFVAGTCDFQARVEELFQRARENAPSVLFVDDADVIFAGAREQGLYRYLLTQLDGLVGPADGARVCVMLTAMDPADLPPALTRSGRVELWLDMRLPDPPARRALLDRHLAPVLGRLGPLDVERLVAAAEGFTGADLVRLVEAGKLLVARDRALRRQPPVTKRFLQAAAAVRANAARVVAARAADGAPGCRG